MALSPDIASEVVACCRQNAGEIAEALSRALDVTLEVDPEKIESYQYSGPSPEWNGPGLLMVLKVGEHAAVAVLASTSGFVPAWTKNPDPTGKSKLTTLSQELGMTLLPEAYMPEDFAAGYVENVAQALERGGVGNGSGAVHCVLKGPQSSSALRLLWPATSPDAILKSAVSPQPAAEKPASVLRGAAVQAMESEEERLAKLPTYVRSLLRIELPVSVQLASTKQPVSRILNIGPGSIIQFEKNCEQPLTLCIGNQVIAEGEAVKVGEKFGIRLTNMVLPGERFFALRGRRAG